MTILWCSERVVSKFTDTCVSNWYCKELIASREQRDCTAGRVTCLALKQPRFDPQHSTLVPGSSEPGALLGVVQKKTKRKEKSRNL